MISITEKDLRVLRKRTSKGTRIAVMIAFPVVIVFNVVAGIINFHLSARFASFVDLTFPQVIQKWFEGTSVTEQYTGIFLKAIERWTTGLIQITFAVFFAVLLISTLKRIARERRILAFIEENRNESALAGTDP
ncbi:MAG: hypothetical protein NT011_01860 [Kiritimatiellaeota bacterium]|nr:hypothetical protein [Kiritimatiellota bacterium]